MRLPDPNGTLTLHRFNGVEVYRLVSAVVFPIEHSGDEPTDLWFEVTTDPDAVSPSPDLAEYRPKPSAGLMVELSAFDAEALLNARFEVPIGFRDDEEYARASLCYFQHQDLDENHLLVSARHGDVFRVTWSSVTTDVNYYDRSKPDTRVVIEGDFSLLRTGEEVREYARAYC